MIGLGVKTIADNLSGAALMIVKVDKLTNEEAIEFAELIFKKTIDRLQKEENESI